MCSREDMSYTFSYSAILIISLRESFFFWCKRWQFTLQCSIGAMLLYTIQLNFWFEDFFGILCAGFGLGTEHREMKMAQCLSLRSSAQTGLQTQILSGAAMQHDTNEYDKDWGQLEMFQLNGINNKNSCHMTRTPLWAGLSLALFCNSWTSYILISWPISYFLCDFSY